MKYGAILIDPPWEFKTYGGKKVVPTQGPQPYRTMALNEIAGLPLPSMMARDCAVFLWQYDALPHATGLLAQAWGMRVVTDNVFIWQKTDNGMGMGYWTRKDAETVALLVKGRPARKSKGVRQLIQAPRREHSRKPDEIYERIEALVDGPYLEMFARQRRPGWDAWGNEVDKFTAVVDIFS